MSDVAHCENDDVSSKSGGHLAVNCSDEKTRILLKTSALVLVWIVYGMYGSLVPATLYDLTYRYEATPEEMSRALVCGSIGGIVGGFLAVLGDRFYSKIDLLIGLTLVINAFLLALKPMFLELYWLAILNFLDGILWTFMNSAGNAQIVALWGESNGPPMQALHLGFPIGATLGPLIALPFVSKGDVEDSDQSNDRYPDNSEIEKAYWIVAAFVLSMGLLFLVFQLIRMPVKRKDAPERKEKLTWAETVSPSSWSPGNPRFGVFMVLCMAGFYLLHVGTFKAMSTYHAQYAIDVNFTTPTEATILSSSISFAGILSRALGIPLTKYMSIYLFTFICVYGQTACTILLAFWGTQDRVKFWISCCLTAFFREPIWPCGYTFTDRFIILLTIVAGIADIVARLSDFIFGWLNGYMYTYVSMESIYYVSSVCGILFCIHLILMTVIGLRQGNRFKKIEKLSKTVSVGKINFGYNDDSKWNTRL